MLDIWTMNSITIYPPSCWLGDFSQFHCQNHPLERSRVRKHFLKPSWLTLRPKGWFTPASAASRTAPGLSYEWASPEWLWVRGHWEQWGEDMDKICLQRCSPHFARVKPHGDFKTLCCSAGAGHSKLPRWIELLLPLSYSAAFCVSITPIYGLEDQYRPFSIWLGYPHPFSIPGKISLTTVVLLIFPRWLVYTWGPGKTVT